LVTRDFDRRRHRRCLDSRVQSELRDLIRPKEKLMESSTSEEITEKSVSAKSGADSSFRDSVERESSKPVQTPFSKVGVDAERLRSSITKLTSNSTKELEKLIAELEALQEFLKSETGRVRGEIENVLDGIKIIVEAIAPWKTACVGGEQNNTRPNGRDKIKRWP
jgi:hypothetical protein